MTEVKGQAEAALLVVLTHAKYTGLQDIGTISSLSKTLNASSSTLWQALYKKASKVASGSIVKYTPSSYCSIPCPCGYCDFCKWVKDHENTDGSFSNCFTNPDTTVLDRVGYARASRCLLSETCHLCGNIASRANPLTLNRTCPSCAKEDDSSALILGTKVTSNFYLEKSEFGDLPSASVERSGGTKSTMYLLSDVLSLAYNKYGGEEGFMAERERRIASKRPTRQQPSRSVGEDNPYKRSKAVEEETFDPLSFRAQDMEALPIGVIERELGGVHSEWTNRQPIKCSCCALEGSPGSIASHEWFAHGLTIKPTLKQGVVKLMNLSEKDFCLRFVQSLEEPEELSELIGSVKADYSYVMDQRHYDEEYGQTNLVVWKVKYDFGNDVQITILFRDYSVDLIDPGVRSKYLLRIEAQVGGINKPATTLVDLFQDSFGEIIHEKEADKFIFDKLMGGLGLQYASPTQLFMSLVARVSTNGVNWQGRHAMLIDDFISIYSDTLSENMPIMGEVRLGLNYARYPQNRPE